MELRGCRLQHLASVFAEDAIVYGDVHRHLEEAADWDDVAASLTSAMRSGQRDERRTQLALATFRSCSWSLGRTLEPIDEAVAARQWGERHLWALLTQRSIRGLRPSNGRSWGWLRADELRRIETWMRARSVDDPRHRGLDLAIERAVAQRCDLLAYDA